MIKINLYLLLPIFEMGMCPNMNICLCVHVHLYLLFRLKYLLNVENRERGVTF